MSNAKTYKGTQEKAIQDAQKVEKAHLPDRL